MKSRRTLSEATAAASRCSCISDEIDLSDAQRQLEEAMRQLHALRDKFHTEMSDTVAARTCTLKSALFTLQAVDNKLHDVIGSIEGDADGGEDAIVSNFGVSVKAEAARKGLEAVRGKHEHLRREWYSHDDHLNRLAGKVKAKDDELKRQSVFCTTQGLVLGRMLWRASQTNDLLDSIVAQEGMVAELLQLLDGSLYGFAQTYRDEMPEPSADEYQYVLCLCGVLGNLASVPDGRFLLTNQPICRDVFDQIIGILPHVQVPKAEGLKRLMLTAVYNITICKEGEEYARGNRSLLRNLSRCLKPPHTNRIVILTLKIINGLTSGIPDESYMRRINEALPRDTLEELQRSKDSCTVRKQAKNILSSLMEFRGKEAKTQCCLAPTNDPVLAYYVFAEPPPRLRGWEPSGMISVSVSESRGMLDSESGSKTNEVSTNKSSESSATTTSTLSVQVLVAKEKCPATPVEGNLEQEGSSELCRPSTLSVPNARSLAQIASRSVASEEMRTVEYRLPCLNLQEIFSLAISENNANVDDGKGGGGEENTNMRSSIITVYQINNGATGMVSENSFNPFCSTVSTNTSLTTVPVGRVENPSLDVSLQTSDGLLDGIANSSLRA